MSKLSKIAKTVISVGNYTPLDDIILNYPNGVEVNGITIKAAKNQPRAIAFTYNATGETDNGSDNDAGNGSDTNDNDVYYFFAESGDLKKIVTAWQAKMTIDEINAELAAEPVVIKIYKIQTRNGRDYVKAEIIDTDNDAGNDAETNA